MGDIPNTSAFISHFWDEKDEKWLHWKAVAAEMHFGRSVISSLFTWVAQKRFRRHPIIETHKFLKSKKPFGFRLETAWEIKVLLAWV